MRDAGFPLLTFIIFTPVAGAVLVAVLPRRRPEVVRAVGYVATAATMGFVGYLLYTFDTSASGYQLVENHPWIDTLGVRYLVGVDGISRVQRACLLQPSVMAIVDRGYGQPASTVWS